MKIKTKVQLITYESHDGSLGKLYTTSDKRISIPEARGILDSRSIEYKELLKVKYENVELEIPESQFESLIY